MRFRGKLPEKELKELYINKKKSLEDIGKIYGVSRIAVWKYCRHLGINRRTKSEARIEALKQRKLSQEYVDINEFFFSSWSQNMAYVLGLLITDGCISKPHRGTYQIALCINDLELLEKVRKAMQSTHKITPSKHQRGLYLFHFARERIVNDLIKLGLTPKKSLTVRFPKVPNKYLRDFIRGVFDGDGGIWFNARTLKSPLATSFTSGSKDFIYELENRLQALGMPRRNIYIKRGEKHNSYSFVYHHENSKRLFKILYQRLNNNRLYLDRKYNKFKEGLEKATLNERMSDGT